MNCACLSIPAFPFTSIVLPQHMSESQATWLPMLMGVIPSMSEQKITPPPILLSQSGAKSLVSILTDPFIYIWTISGGRALAWWRLDKNHY